MKVRRKLLNWVVATLPPDWKLWQWAANYQMRLFFDDVERAMGRLRAAAHSRATLYIPALVPAPDTAEMVSEAYQAYLDNVDGAGQEELDPLPAADEYKPMPIEEFTRRWFKRKGYPPPDPDPDNGKDKVE